MTAAVGVAGKAADRADAVSSRMAGTGFCWGARPPRQDAAELQPLPHRAGSTPATLRGGAGLGGETPSVLSGLPRERSRSASDRDRLYAQRNYPVDNGRGSRDVITAAGRGPPRPAPSGGFPSGIGHAATVAVDCGGAISRPPGTLFPAPRQRFQAPPGAGPLTPTSDRSSGMPRTIGTTPRRRGARPRPRPATLGMRPLARRGARALGTEGSSAATVSGYRLRRPARRASCSGTSSRMSCSPAGITPTILPPLGATCAGSISRTWTRATGSRVDCPAGSPRPAPSRGDRARILPPCQQHAREVPSSAGTRWTARCATARSARRAGTSTARRAGCT